VSTLITEINEPRLAIEVKEPTNQTLYYQVVVRNDGGSPANHVKISMFFWDTSIDAVEPAVTDENITITKNDDYTEYETIKESTPDVYVATVPRLAPNALVTLYVLIPINYAYTFDTSPNVDEIKKYYIAASFDKGSNIYSNFRLADIQRGLMPDIRHDRNLLPAPTQLIIVTTAMAAFLFTIALIRNLYIEHITNRLKRFYLDPLLLIAVTVIGSLLVFYFGEFYLLQLMHPVDVVPFDIFAEPQFAKNTIPIILLAIFLRYVLTFFIIYLIIKKGIFRLKQYRRYVGQEDHYVWLIIWDIFRTGMWLPIYSILALHFGQALHDLYISPFYLLVIMVVADIIRMSILTFRFTPSLLKQNAKLINFMETIYSFTDNKALHMIPEKRFLIKENIWYKVSVTVSDSKGGPIPGEKPEILSKDKESLTFYLNDNENYHNIITGETNEFGIREFRMIGKSKGKRVIMSASMRDADTVSCEIEITS
jgi:hypothetical protein